MKKNKFNQLLLLLFLTSSSTCNAKFLWVNFSYNAVATFFYDPGTIRGNKYFKTIWILTNYNKPTRSGEYSVLVKQEYDCLRARYKILRLKSHALKNGKGPIINIYPRQKNWKLVMAGTADADLMKIICWK